MTLPPRSANVTLSHVHRFERARQPTVIASSGAADAGVAIVALLTVLALRIVEYLGLSMNDWRVATVTASVVVGLFGIFFGGTGYYSPWRWVWWIIPPLAKQAFPDINGVWVGTVSSNFPIIKATREAALSVGAVEEAALAAMQKDRSAVAVELRANLFKLSVSVAASSTGGESDVLIAKPWREQNSERIHLSNIYRQDISQPGSGDESSHLGAADLRLDPNVPDRLNGVYWTRRNWQTGLNTAGTIELRRVEHSSAKNKSLLQYANEEAERISGGGA